MKKLMIPVCSLVVGLAAGMVLARLLPVQDLSKGIGPTPTEIALSTLYDLHRGATSEECQRGLAVTLAQMYIDAEGRDEQVRSMIASAAFKIPILAEEIKAIETGQKATQHATGN